uniref:Uncharacterized protein n=1 Tax=Romanomermis culicivorax TaxID=13658 RepID=A0A915K4T0_ROMCU
MLFSMDKNDENLRFRAVSLLTDYSDRRLYVTYNPGLNFFESKLVLFDGHVDVEVDIPKKGEPGVIKQKIFAWEINTACQPLPEPVFFPCALA